MRLGNDLLEVELRRDGWRARWPRGNAAIDVREPPGEWAIRRADAFGRSGTWARLAEVALHVPDLGGALVVQADRLECFAGLVELGVATERVRRLENGYQSWDYAGVRTAAGRSWWSLALAAPDGRGLAMHALAAQRFATAFATEPSRNGLRLAARCGGAEDLRLPGSSDIRTVPTEPVALLGGVDVQDALEDLAALAGAHAGARRWDGDPVLGWESWYHYGLAVRPAHVLANARLLRERLGARGFRLAQVDDGWQRAYGDWRPRDGWDPAALARELRALGCSPGLWLAPFMVAPEARGSAPDALVLDAGGAPVADQSGRHALDASDPQARAWLRDLGARVRDWGYEMVKLDFLYLGAAEGARHDRSITGTAALRLGLQAFLDGLGDDAYVLACGAPLLAVVGLAHANRIGGDLAAPLLDSAGAAGVGFAGIRAQARNAAARAFAHRRLFANDPDVVMAGGPYSIEEARALATLAAFCGGLFLLADDLAALPDAKRAVLEHDGLLELAWGDGLRALDLLETVDEEGTGYWEGAAAPSVWLAHRDGRAALALFNWTDAAVRREVPAGISPTRELWTGERVTRGSSLVVPPRGARVLLA